MRWPGVIEPGRVINDICSLQDFIPTFAAGNGEADLVAKVKNGYKIVAKTYRVHLDGYNLTPFLAGKEKESPRDGFIYWSDDGECMAIRMKRFKAVLGRRDADAEHRLAAARTNGHIQRQHQDVSPPLLERRPGEVRAIVDFIERVTKPSGAELVPPARRIAIFDNDGNLWCEHPLPVQGFFLADRIKALAVNDRALKTRQPFKAFIEHVHKMLHELGKRGIAELFFATHHRRHYRQVYKYFLEAADTIQIRRYPLTRHLYVPEPYAPDQALEIEARRQRAFRELSQTASGVPLRILVFGRLRSIVETAAGPGLRLAHLPNEFVIGVPRDKLARLCHSTAFAWLDARSLHPEFQLLVLLTMQRAPHAIMETGGGNMGRGGPGQDKLMRRRHGPHRDFGMLALLNVAREAIVNGHRVRE